MSDLIQNAVKIYDGGLIVYLTSSYRHDYVTYKGVSGSVSVDGGLDYAKRAYDTDDSLRWEEWSLYEDSTLDEMVNMMIWGTRGKKNDEPLKYVLLNECETDHLENIIKYRERRLDDIAKSIEEAVEDDVDSWVVDEMMDKLNESKESALTVTKVIDEIIRRREDGL